jgi:hypothetical protein
MPNRYLRIEPNDAKIIKDQFVFSETGLNNILRILRNYKISRKKELVFKNKLKLEISSLKAKLNAFESTLPEDERKEALDKIYRKNEKNLIMNKAENIKRTHIKNDTEPIKNDPYEDLEDIRSKLSRFSSE